MVTDLTPLKQCVFEDISVSGLTRLKSNEFPDDIGRFRITPGGELKLVVAAKSRLPVKELRVLSESSLEGAVTSSPIGMVPFPEEATYIPDPVLESETVDIPANTTQSFLLKIPISRHVAPGLYQVSLEFESATHVRTEKTFEVEILDLSLEEANEPGNKIFWTHWEALRRYYKLELWSEPFWKMADRYLAEMKAGGMTSIMVVISEDYVRYPLPQIYYHCNYRPSMIQWLRKEDGSFKFDYSIYDRYIKLNMKHGIDREIECHAMLPCKRQRPLLNYFDMKSGQKVTHETSHDSPDYIFAMESFIKDFAKHNRQKGWNEKIAICPYDEPSDIDSFRKVAGIVRTHAPEFRITAAMTREKALEAKEVVDIVSVASETLTPENIGDILEAGFEPRWYNCCFPQWGNFLFSSPLADSYRIPWMTVANGLKGFLRWSMFNWAEDPYDNPAFNWPTGDMFLLYPGKNGPASSLRWEAYKTGVEDLKLFLAYLKKADNPQKQKLKHHLAELGRMKALSHNNDINSWREKLFSMIK